MFSTWIFSNYLHSFIAKAAKAVKNRKKGHHKNESLCLNILIQKTQYLIKSMFTSYKRYSN